MKTTSRLRLRRPSRSLRTTVLLDRFLGGAVEYDVDILCDGDEVYVAGIMEHIEEAGVHSGDSARVIPPVVLSRRTRLR